MDQRSTPRTKALVIYDVAESGNVWGYSLTQIGIDVALIPDESDVIKRWSEELPDLIVLEDFDAEFEELEICRKLRQETPVPILLLTVKSDESFLLDAYQAGVDECIVQPVSPRLFLAKVRAWLRSTQVLPSAAVDALQLNGFRLDTERSRLATPTGSYKLTTLEARLLYILMSHPGKTLDAGTLIERTWGCFSGGDKVMLKNVVYRLRRKLETDPRQPHHLLTEANGYMFLA